MKSPRFVVRAARGDSWLEARFASDAGPVRYRGNLVQGNAIRLDGRRFWMRIGAGENLDVLVNGKRATDVPAGTSTVLVTPRGLETIAVG